MGRITISIKTENPDLIGNALNAEIESAPFAKSKISLKKEKGRIVVEMESENMAALRGTFNSTMNWLHIILLGMGKY